jgi:hypothetical protein
MSSHSMKEVDYRCTDSQCGYTTTFRYFPDEPVNPMLCCIRCRAGFGVDHREMVAGKIGMAVVGKSRLVGDETSFRKLGAFTSTGAVT